MKKLISVLVILVIAIGAAFLLTSMKNKDKSNNSYTNNSSSSSNNTNSSKSSSSPNQQATDKVTIQNFAFSPASISVTKGTTVTWTNQDTATHTVQETDGKNGPKSQDLATGQSFQFTYNSPGTYNYHCSIHPDMVGSVTVTE